ncbi:HNH endonuclease [Nocardia niigatensis]
MWPLNAPPYDSGDVFQLCCDRIQDEDLKLRLLASVDKIRAASKRYCEAAEAISVHLLCIEDFRVPSVKNEELTRLYENGMVRKRSAGRPIYDAIYNSPEHGRCPMCGLRGVETLDHYMPKSKFDALTVDPMNLIPACHACNRTKRDKLVASPDEQGVHPYFDKLSDEEWLFADVIEDATPVIRFRVQPPCGWDGILQRRVHNHFEKYGLGRLYSLHAAQELPRMRSYLVRLADSGASERIPDYLDDLAESHRAVELNHWKTAMHVALAKSSWYATGGYSRH